MREIEIQVSHFSQWGLVFPRRGFQLRGLSDKNAVSPSSSICQWSQRRKNGAHQVSCSFEASVAISGLSFFCGLGSVIFLRPFLFFYFLKLTSSRTGPFFWVKWQIMTYFVSSSLSRRWSEQHFIVFLPAITFRPNYEKFFLSVVLELLCWISLTFLETKDKGLGVLEFRPLLRRMRAFSSIDRKKGSHLRIIIRWASLKYGPRSFSRFGDDKKRVESKDVPRTW